MIAVLKPNASQEQKDKLITWLRTQFIDVHVSEGADHTVLGLVGDCSGIDTEFISGLEIVQSVHRVSQTHEKCSRRQHPEDTVIRVGEAALGGGNFCLIAGPCSVESREQIIEIANSVKAAGANILRGGAFKPRTSPYEFQGMKEEGLKLLSEAKKESGLPVVSEITNIASLELFEDVDIVQVGARNMQNFDLLRELGRTKKTILLKRGLANTVKELLMSAEYICAGGNENIILCERGIRTYESVTRNTLDLSSVPVLHELSHLPVVVDPSHATGNSKYVIPMALAAAAAGADGIMVEVHNDPVHALCDGAQSLTPKQFEELVKRIKAVREAIAI